MAKSACASAIPSRPPCAGAKECSSRCIKPSRQPRDKTPNSKLQTAEKLQIPNLKRQIPQPPKRLQIPKGKRLSWQSEAPTLNHLSRQNAVAADQLSTTCRARTQWRRINFGPRPSTPTATSVPPPARATSL